MSVGNPTAPHLGERFRALRNERGWTLDGLAVRTELSKAFLSRLEANDRQPSLEALVTLARVFGVPISALLEPAPARVMALNVGNPEHLPGWKGRSAILKRPVNTPLHLGKNGFEGDSQADRLHHGSSDRAVCVYPLEHYQFWQSKLKRKLEDASFGENLSTAGLTEYEVCIGDVFKLGFAKVQVSEPRSPCRTLAVRLAQPKLEEWFAQSGLTGFYLRVLKPGMVRPEDTLELLERPVRGITIAEANRVMHMEVKNRTSALHVLTQPALSVAWKAALEVKLESG